MLKFSAFCCFQCDVVGCWIGIWIGLPDHVPNIVMSGELSGRTIFVLFKKERRTWCVNIENQPFLYFFNLFKRLLQGHELPLKVPKGARYCGTSEAIL